MWVSTTSSNRDNRLDENRTRHIGRPIYKIPTITFFFTKKYLDYQVISTVSNRLWTKKFWNVDPDAYMCRKTLNFLPKQLLKFQNVIQQCEGNIFLGDDLSKLSDERIDKYICPLFKK